MMHTAAEQEALQAVQPARQQRRHQGRELRYEGTRWPCAHCGAKAVIQDGHMVTITLRETAYQCTSVECGHCFVVTAEVSRTTVPSATPNVSVNIPLSSHVRRNLLRVVLDNAGEALHQTRFTPEVTGDLFADGGNTS